MAISVFDLFKIGLGPSSSHTVGPMRAARTFARRLEKDGILDKVAKVKSELFGSLGATGKGHGSDIAVLLGLQGESPRLVDTDKVDGMVAAIREGRKLNLLGKHDIPFIEAEHLILHKRKTLPFHPNGMIFEAFDAAGESISKRAYYSVGGGFVVDEAAVDAGFNPPGVTELKHPFKSGAELLALCERHGKTISQIMLENELAWRTEDEIRAGLLEIWSVMQACVKRGCEREGTLPGGLKVKRRAADMYQKLLASPEAALRDPLTVLDWVNLYALAVNEENAGGGRVVTAPTNGAAGIIPAVMHYYARFTPNPTDDGIVRFFLTAGAIGILFKLNASISGAEVGCQGEVGSACSMAAGALAEVLGGTPEQVENAAEIGMEHNLGLTCDPVGGLVQVPCIERNAMASIKAINAARMALRGDGQHFVSLDRVIKTMRDTGRDMNTKYKETARGGLAINVIEVPVNIVEC
ncbi:L-serine ammonia-lyase [Iodobacter fluviatilis]|uniref:L-serine dehydratase n=1 Tax=Iodobacter fluviatilis TaxID=537 RepID=A0A377Q4C4_9NEIS|nr:L-serine ammonia-lyase [Iodobacter fluviatilis]TCU90625.1 L-serine ammonia-lyase [Iodobacter fluviatilis]STQ89652.1 L-serine dehydratase 1 [Iodobacter fluviatilis]